MDVDVGAFADMAGEGAANESRSISGQAAHDAQMMARICPAAMIFVASREGVSHNPREFTDQQDLLDGASVLLDVATAMVLRC